MKDFDSQPSIIDASVAGLLSEVPLHNLNVNPQKNRLSVSFHEHIRNWAETAENVTLSLDSLGIKYVLMKVFLVPNVRMDDVDLLVENEKDVHDALNMLRQKGYSLYSDRYSLNPLKITAMPNKNNIQVDIYPEATWFNMRYAPTFFISSNRIKRDAWGFQAYMPNPSLDVYIVATHSYNHGFISLAEAAHVVRLMSEHNLNWDLLKDLADSYELNHALLIYLKIAQLCVKERKNQAEISTLINEVLQKDSLSRFYSEWFDRASKRGFPLKIPLKLRMLSASVRLFRPYLNSYTKVYDEILGYGLAFLYRGDRRSLKSRGLKS